MVNFIPDMVYVHQAVGFQSQGRCWEQDGKGYPNWSYNGECNLEKRRPTDIYCQVDWETRASLGQLPRHVSYGPSQNSTQQCFCYSVDGCSMSLRDPYVKDTVLVVEFYIFTWQNLWEVRTSERAVSHQGRACKGDCVNLAPFFLTSYLQVSNVSSSSPPYPPCHGVLPPPWPKAVRAHNDRLELSESWPK